MNVAAISELDKITFCGDLKESAHKKWTSTEQAQHSVGSLEHHHCSPIYTSHWKLQRKNNKVFIVPLKILIPKWYSSAANFMGRPVWQGPVEGGDDGGLMDLFKSTVFWITGYSKQFSEKMDPALVVYAGVGKLGAERQMQPFRHSLAFGTLQTAVLLALLCTLLDWFSLAWIISLNSDNTSCMSGWRTGRVCMRTFRN